MGQSLHLTNARFTRDPEISESQSGMKIAKFAVAIDGWDSKKKEKFPEFFDCVAFDKTAETIENYCEKGRSVNINGKIHKETWEDKTTGEKRSTWKVTVDPYGLELGPRPQGQSADDDLTPTKPQPTSLFGN